MYKEGRFNHNKKVTEIISKFIVPFWDANKKDLVKKHGDGIVYNFSGWRKPLKAKENEQ